MTRQASCGLVGFVLFTAVSRMAAAQAGTDTTITIRASSSALEFIPSSVVVKQGTRVTLRLVNAAGTLPHNFVLVKTDDDIDPLAMAAMQEGGDYVPKDQTERMIAYTKLASPGATVEVTFVAPPPGAYPYVCLVSGHSGMMLGTLRSVR